MAYKGTVDKNKLDSYASVIPWKIVDGTPKILLTVCNEIAISLSHCSEMAASILMEALKKV